MLKLISKAPQKLTVFDKSNDFNEGFYMAYFNLQVYKKLFLGFCDCLTVMILDEKSTI